MSSPRPESTATLSDLPVLPNGWAWCVPSDICETIASGSTPTADLMYSGAGDIPFIKVYNLTHHGELDFTNKPTFIDAKTHTGPLGRSRCYPDDVLMNIVGPPLGKVSIVPSTYPEWNINQAVVVFRPKDAILNRYLAYALLTDFLLKRLTSKAKATAGQHNIGVSMCRSLLPIPLAPTAEQRRIVAKIEELFSDLDAGVAALERVRANLKRYRAAVLKAAVEGRLTEQWRAAHPPAEPADQLLARILTERRKQWEQTQLRKFAAAGKAPPKGWREKYEEPPTPMVTHRAVLPAGWCWATIDQVTAGDRSSAYGVLQPGDDVPNGIPLVRVCDVADGRVAVDQLKRIDPAISAQYERTVLRGGEVLLTIVGTIGRTAIAPEAIRGANTARAVAVIPPTSLLMPRFIELMLRESSMRARLTGAAHEVARKTLNLEDVRIASIPLAPLDEQAQIVAEVERRLSVVDAVEAEIAHSLQRAGRLRQAILKRAFEGKLVPQDPADEPAEKLLQRICSTTAPSSRSKRAGLGKRSRRAPEPAEAQ